MDLSVYRLKLWQCNALTCTSIHWLDLTIWQWWGVSSSDQILGPTGAAPWYMKSDTPFCYNTEHSHWHSSLSNDLCVVTAALLCVLGYCWLIIKWRPDIFHAHLCLVPKRKRLYSTIKACVRAVFYLQLFIAGVLPNCACPLRSACTPRERARRKARTIRQCSDFYMPCYLWNVYCPVKRGYNINW